MKNKIILSIVLLSFSSVFAGDFVALVKEHFLVKGITPAPEPDPNMSVIRPTRRMTTSTCDQYNGSFPSGKISSFRVSNQSYPKNFCLTSEDHAKLHRECFDLNEKAYMTDYYCYDSNSGDGTPLPGSSPTDVYFPLDNPWPENPNGQSEDY